MLFKETAGYVFFSSVGYTTFRDTRYSRLSLNTTTYKDGYDSKFLKDMSMICPEEFT